MRGQVYSDGPVFVVRGGLPRASSGMEQVLVVAPLANNAMVLFDAARAWCYRVSWSDRLQWYAVRWWTP